jgi:hypothetical protein
VGPQVAPQRGGRALAGALGDEVDRQVGLLEQVLGVADTLLDRPSGRV